MKKITSTRSAGSSSTGNDGATDLQRLDDFVVVDERNLSPGIEMTNRSEGVRDFRRRVAPYQHVDLFATAWPLGRSAGKKKHRKRLEIGVGVGVSVGLLGLFCMRQRAFKRWREPDAVTYIL